MNYSDGRLTRNKFRAVKTRVDDITFDSKREAAVYFELKMLSKAGEINGLQVKPRLDLHTTDAKGIKRKVCSHIPDFKYFDTKAKEWRFLEVKGHDHALGRLKRKWAEAEHGIAIEVRK